MSTIELVIRVATLTELGILLCLVGLGRRRVPGFRSTMLLLLGIASYVAAPAVVFEWQWGYGAYPVLFMAIAVPAWFWFFAGDLFTDDFHPPAWSWLLAIGTGMLGVINYCGAPANPELCMPDLAIFPGWMVQLVKVVWVIGAAFLLLRDWQSDLVASRRRLRQWFTIAIGAYIVVILLVEIVITGAIPGWLELMNSLFLLLLVTTFLLHMTTINNDNLLLQQHVPASTPGPALSPLAQEAKKLMSESRYYATEGLTINSLAQHLRTQPHLLRQVINGELGYRNFNAFVNEYRIDEIAARLAQDEYRETPLLTLALDAGFRSLAPFNRAFRDKYAMTPSEFRQNLPE